MTNVFLPMNIENALNDGAMLVVSVSGGKDSDCMALELARLRRLYRWPGYFVCIHAHVGRMEWPQTLPHCQELAQRIQAAFVVVKHEERDLLDGIWRRMEVRPDAPPFPSAAARWCTSDFKRSVIDKWLRNNVPDGQNAICTIGFRREESPAREKKPYWQPRPKATSFSKRRHVVDWHPILDYSLADVWQVLGYTLDELRAIRNQVRESGVIPPDFKAHPAYALGNERVSCAMCILGSLNDLRNGARENPGIYQELVDIELASGFTFQPGNALYEVDPDTLRPDQLDQLDME